MTLADAERLVILARLRHHGGHRVRAAESLGISTKTLYLRINKYTDEGHAVPAAPAPLRRKPAMTRSEP